MWGGVMQAEASERRGYGASWLRTGKGIIFSGMGGVPCHPWLGCVIRAVDHDIWVQGCGMLALPNGLWTTLTSCRLPTQPLLV